MDFPAVYRSSKMIIAVLVSNGFGMRRKVASVMTASVPSDPTISFVRSYPVTFLTVLPPVLRTFPSAVTISSPITKSLVTPYFTPRGPTDRLRQSFPLHILDSTASGPQNFPVRRHDFQSDHKILGDSIFDATRTPGVFCKIPAYGTYRRRRGIGRIHKIVRFSQLVYVPCPDPRADSHDQIIRVYFKLRIPLREIEHNAALDRQGAS